MEQLAQLAHYSAADGNFLIMRYVKIILCKRHLTLLSIMHEVFCTNRIICNCEFLH